MRRSLAWLGGRPAILPLTARLLCARTVKETGRFFARELLRPKGVFLYTVRDGGTRVAIRHVGIDAVTLAEVFYHRYYDPPQDVARVLAEAREILDLGANIGAFGALALVRFPDASITAYEPDPENAAVHEQTQAANGSPSGWALVRAAAGARNRETRFVSGLDAGSHLIEDDAPGTWEAAGEQITVPIKDVVPELAKADLVKMDIEGGEWAILADPRFAESSPRALVLEYHPYLCPGQDPHLVVERALTRADLQIHWLWRRDDGHGMLWAWRAHSD